MAPKKPDPISDRAKALNDQIAALEAQIQKLDTQLQNPGKPKLRSTTLPPGATPARPVEKPAPEANAPVFEEVPAQPVRGTGEAGELFNDLGIRKYDLPALIERIRNHVRGPTTTNPRLVNYLAAGGVHGLRPLRYEKRVARNRFIVFTIVVLLILIGMAAVLSHHH